MRGRVNDWLRFAISQCVTAVGLAFSGLIKVRLWRFETKQDRLKRTYRGTLHKNKNAGGRFALTSGSAGDPKEILYTNRRVREVKIVFSDMFARACRAFHITRTSLYVFSSFEPDDSLTSMLLDEADLPNYLTTLQAPYRVSTPPCNSRACRRVRRRCRAVVDHHYFKSRRSLQHQPINALDLLRRPHAQLPRQF